jgi:ribonuclease HIII
MPSRKGMTELEMKDIIKFLLSNGWVQKNGENNPYLLFRFQLENNIVKFYQSKRGITFFCNTQVMMKQIIDRNIFKDTDFKGILEIDDAGIGSLIGGVLIGFHVPYVLENCRHSIVEVKYFQSPLFEQ